MSITEDSIKSVLTFLVSAFSAEAEANAKQHPAYPEICGLVAANDPEDLYFAFRYKIDQVFETAIKEQAVIAHPCAIAIWMDWNFFERHLSSICTKFYGSPCSADRARWILNAFLTWNKTGEEPTVGTNYWHPRTGTGKQWLDMVRGIHGLLRGRVDEFLMAYYELAIVDDMAKREAQTTPAAAE